MKHAKSNKNLFKKAPEGNHKKEYLFKKSSTKKSFNYIKSNNASGRKKYLISLLDKNTPKNYNTNKFNFKGKSNNKNEIYLTSGIENINVDDNYKTMHPQRNINIRLNLNNEIINNNFNNYYTTITKNYNKSKNSVNVNEKIKEKDQLITKLQKELLQSQKLLNQIQKDKQNELTITYNSIKKYDKLDKNNNRSLNALLKSPSLLKFNSSKKIKGNINKNNYNIFNSGINFNNKRKYKIATLSPKQSHIRCFSSSPNRFFTYNLDNLESYNSAYLTKNALYPKSNNITGLGKSNSNIFLKKNDKFPTEFYITRQLSYSNYNFKTIKNSINKDFFDKCQKLKKRAKLLLDNYLLLIKDYNKSNNENK